MMCEESDDEKCNCIECYNQPNRAFRISKEIKPEISGLRRGFYLSKNDANDSLHTQLPETPSNKAVFFSAAAAPPKEAQSATKKPFLSFTPETIECETISIAEIHDGKEKIELKCVKSKCIENNEMIDMLNQGAFRVSCTDGCTLTMHRNCFEKALGSGKKKELKSSICPTDACGSLVHRIDNRAPGKDNDFVLWLRCEGKEPERPKKEEKNKDIKKKDERKERDRYKKDRCEGEEVRKVEKKGEIVEATMERGTAAEERAFISLARPNNALEEDAKRNLVKPLPADLNARPIERKEDALMSKYAVKEANTKEIRKKNKKEVRQVVLPGLTVKGQRGRKDEEEEAVSVNEDSIQNGAQMETPELRYEEGHYGFAIPEEVDENVVSPGVFLGGGRGGSLDINAHHNPFEHPLSFGHGFAFMHPTVMHESDVLINHSHPSSQPLNHTGRSSMSTCTESAATDGPPLIENPYDYPTLEKDCIRERKELINFFETHTPVLEENAALFDSPRIDLEQLRNMLESFIEFQFYGNYEEKNNMTETLRSIFTGEVESDIIPFLMDLHCFKCGYVDGRLVVSVKTEGKQRREREDQLRKEKEEEERRLKEEEYSRRFEMEEEGRRREAKKVEEVRRAVMEIEEKRRREDEELKLIEEESIRMEEERQRKKNEEKRRLGEERKIEGEASERKNMVENKIQETNKMQKEERRRVGKETEHSSTFGDERNISEEKRMKEDDNREKRLLELVDANEKFKQRDLLRQKDPLKKAREKELERQTRCAILGVRGLDESKKSSSESSPERKDMLTCSAFRSTAPPFVPRTFLPKAELNPNAPSFIPSQSAKGTLIDHNGTEVDKKWIDFNTQVLKENKNTIDKLKIRVSELEADKFTMETKIRLAELEMSKNDGIRVNEDRKKHETISQLEAQVRRLNEQIAWKNTEISEIIKESEKKSEQLNQMRNDAKSKLEDMNLKMRDCNMNAIKERTEKENVMAENMRVQEEKRKWILERKIACAKDAINLCGCIIDKLAMEPEAQVMTSIFFNLRGKWMKHFSTLQHALMGDNADRQSAISLEEPSMPQETDALVKECYVVNYLAMHTMSFRLAALVKKYLRDHRRYYEDAFVIGIIRKWMRSHKDPSQIEATIPQVANMVAQAMGDSPLMPPKYVHVASHSSSVLSNPSTPTRIPILHTDGMFNTQLGSQSTSIKNEPKGWKKASDKVRHVDFNEHECSICLEGTHGGDIAYCEQVSCNEPYHNDCLDRYWKTGGRNCPRCRTPMPPRDAYPALG